MRRNQELAYLYEDMDGDGVKDLIYIPLGGQSTFDTNWSYSGFQIKMYKGLRTAICSPTFNCQIKVNYIKDNLPTMEDDSIFKIVAYLAAAWILSILAAHVVLG